MPKLSRVIWAMGGVITPLAIALPTLAAERTPIGLETPDPYCYMQIGSRTVNLNKLCGTTSALTPLDQLFLARYQALTRNRVGVRPQTPAGVVERAKQMCASIQAGTVAANLPIDNSRTLDADVVKELALQNYCPELDD